MFRLNFAFLYARKRALHANKRASEPSNAHIRRDTFTQCKDTHQKEINESIKLKTRDAKQGKAKQGKTSQDKTSQVIKQGSHHIDILCEYVSKKNTTERDEQKRQQQPYTIRHILNAVDF